MTPDRPLEPRMIRAVHSFDPGFVVDFGCLGRQFPVTIGGETVLFGLPVGRVSGESPHRLELGAPSGAEGLPDSYQLDTQMWGFVSRHHPRLGFDQDGTAIVTRAVLSPSPSASSLVDQARTIRDAIGPWWESVRAWIAAVTGQNIDPTAQPPIVDYGDMLPTWGSAGRGSKSAILNLGPTTIHFEFPKPVAVLNGGLLQSIFDLGSEGESLPLDWQVIVEARAARSQGQWRRSVIDAGTAAELALTRLIDQRLVAAEEPIRDALLQSYRTLGPLGKLYRKLGGSLPANFQASLVDIQNKATHGSQSTLREEAEEAVQVAATVIRQAGPECGLSLFEEQVPLSQFPWAVPAATPR